MRKEFSGKNIKDIERFYPVEEYSVGEWVPNENGIGTPEAVLITFTVGSSRNNFSLGIRLKSAKEVNTLIHLLEEYRDRVWSPD